MIVFPRNTGQRYYFPHYLFFRNLLEAAGQTIKLTNMDREKRGFEIYAFEGNRRILIDFGDHFLSAADLDRFDFCFRFHYSEKHHKSQPRTFPVTPISFNNWKNYYGLERLIRYTVEGNYILNCQRPGGAAKMRRSLIQHQLKEKYGARVDTVVTNQINFWKRINGMLISICIPGARNDILDRGQFQYMAFGACTMSPPLDIILPYWMKPVPDVHYVSLKPDYSDIDEKIRWCENNRSECVAIGRRAKELFRKTSTPQAIWTWIKECVEKNIHEKTA